MDTISEERINKEVVKQEKNIVIDKMSRFWQDTHGFW